jgi:hypothetical protein
MVYVGSGSMPMRARKDIARVAIEAIRAQGRRVLVSQGWADLALISVNRFPALDQTATCSRSWIKGRRTKVTAAPRSTLQL